MGKTSTKHVLRMTVHVIEHEAGDPPDLLAHVELHFDGYLAGFKLVGFGIWAVENGGRRVTFPHRAIRYNGERVGFELLRSVSGTDTEGRRLLANRLIAEFEAGTRRKAKT